MQYKKESTTVIEQIKKMQSRGLTIGDTALAAHYLSNISYPDRSDLSPQRIAQIYNPCPQRQEKNSGFNIKVKEFHKVHGLQIRDIGSHDFVLIQNHQLC